MVSNISAWSLAGASLKASSLAGQATDLALGTGVEHGYHLYKEKSTANRAAELASQGKGVASKQAKRLVSKSRRGLGFFNLSSTDVKVSQLSADDILDGLEQR